MSSIVSDILAPPREHPVESRHTIVYLPPPIEVYDLGPAYQRSRVHAPEPTDKDLVEMLPEPESELDRLPVVAPNWADEYAKLSKYYSELDAIEAAQAAELEERQKQDRLLEGFANDDLMALIRAFDKQVHHVHTCPPPYDGHIPRGLDLQPAQDEEFTVDKFRSSLERFYASYGVGMIRLIKEVQRIRMWDDGGLRTVVTLMVYIQAWCSELIIATVVLFVAALIFFPPFRHFCFDPPRRDRVLRKHDISHEAAISDPHNAPTLQHDMADDWGHAAVEQQATRWADSISELIQSSAKPGNSGSAVEDLQKGAESKVKGKMDHDIEKVKQTGQQTHKDDDEKDKKKMARELYAQPMMKIIGGLVDKWERIENAITPLPPFIRDTHRTTVFFALVFPVLLIATFTSARMVSRISGAIVGFILFGEPLTENLLELLARIDIHWVEKLILRVNILENVPTHAQLVLRLLRDGEHKHRPIPPPSTDPADIGPDREGSDYSDGEDDDEDHEDDEAHSSGQGPIGHDDHHEDLKSKRARMMHGMSAAGKKAATRTRAKLRRTWDKVGHKKEDAFASLAGHKDVDKGPTFVQRKAALQGIPVAYRPTYTGPSRFYVYHPKHGPGHLFIHPPSLPDPMTGFFTPARITFTTFRRVPNSEGIQMPSEEEAQDGVPTEGNLTISINDIVSLKKENNMKWPGRIITSFLLDVEGAGGTGLEIGFIKRTRASAEAGWIGVGDRVLGEKAVEGREETVHFGGIVRRNEMFDRLVALGEQRWEMF